MQGTPDWAFALAVWAVGQWAPEIQNPLQNRIGKPARLRPLQGWLTASKVGDIHWIFIQDSNGSATLLESRGQISHQEAVMSHFF